MKTKNKDLFTNLKDRFESAQKFLHGLIQEKAGKLSNLVETNYNLGLYHLRANNLRDAEFRFRIVLYFRPTHHLALYNLAKCYIAKKQKHAAIEKIKLALKAKKDFPEAEYLLSTLEKSTKIEEIPTPIIQEYYDNIADSYNEKFSPKRGHKVAEYMADLLSLYYEKKNEDTTILDLGCGTGKCSKAVSSLIKCKSIVGVDISQNMLEEAQEITKNKSPLFDKLVHLDFDKFLDKSSAKFDIILAGMSLHFKKNLEKQLKKISHLLEKKGCIIFTIEQAKGTSHTGINPCYENFCYTKSYTKESVQNAGLSLTLLDEITLSNGKSILVVICKK